jgi:rRNA-processing protein FCF1
MSEAAMMRLRERILEVVVLLQAEGALAAPRKARDLRDHHLPILRRFVAGEGMPTDDLHRALWAIGTVALATSDRELSEKASMAANCALTLGGFQRPEC